MGCTKSQVLRFHTSLVTLANQFGEYFIDWQIQKIRNDLDAIHLPDIDILSESRANPYSLGLLCSLLMMLIQHRLRAHHSHHPA